MTLKELLDAKDAAVADDDAKKAAVEELRAALVTAEEASTKATEVRAAAHGAIHDLLAAKGHHFTVDDAGTVTVYHATEDGNGWQSYHPIAGSMSNPPIV